MTPPPCRCGHPAIRHTVSEWPRTDTYILEIGALACDPFSETHQCPCREYTPTTQPCGCPAGEGHVCPPPFFKEN